MGSFKIYATVAGCLALAVSATTARAADLLSAPPPPPAYEPISDVGGGWYLRGDVGVSNYQVGKTSNPELPGARFLGNEMGAGGFAGAGIGYQFNSWFRADATGEYRFSSGLKFRDQEYFYSNAGDLIKGNEFYKSNFSSGVFLVNGYFDLGNWYGITPFIGAGVGYAYNTITGFEHQTMNFYPVALGLNPGINGGYAKNKSYGSFAWALHAGLAYDVSPNLKLEFGYRYLNLGDAQTGGVYCYCNSTNVRSAFRVKEIEAHDFKIGLRWALGGPAAPYEPAPLMRKY